MKSAKVWTLKKKKKSIAMQYETILDFTSFLIEKREETQNKKK